MYNVLSKARKRTVAVYIRVGSKEQLQQLTPHPRKAEAEQAYKSYAKTAAKYDYLSLPKVHNFIRYYVQGNTR
jgi:hypothetical protein